MTAAEMISASGTTSTVGHWSVQCHSHCPVPRDWSDVWWIAVMALWLGWPALVVLHCAVFRRSK